MIKFQFDNKTIDMFTRSDCWVIANHLSKYQKLPRGVITLFRNEDNKLNQEETQWIHAFNYLEINKNIYIIDINGIQTTHELISNFMPTINFIKDRNGFDEYDLILENEEPELFNEVYQPILNNIHCQEFNLNKIAKQINKITKENIYDTNTNKH